MTRRLPILLAAMLAATAAQAADIEIVESWPVETVLNNEDLRDTQEVWLEMIRGARRTLEIETFYVCDEKGKALEPVIRAIEDAAARGVAVRIISDKKFHNIYPEPLDSLGKKKNIEVRIIDVGKLSGGVMHAKYFIVDGAQVFVGSQNFDWRSFTHIHELGLRIKSEKLARAYWDVFELDWKLAVAKDRKSALKMIKKKSYKVPLKIAGAEVTPVFSPEGWIPDPKLFDEDHLVSLIDGAKHELALQVLTYSPVSYKGEFYARLDNALRRAAVRGVHVKLIVADWGKSKPTIDHLKSLAVLPDIDVKLSTIPLWSKGYVPFARVEHAKFLIVDKDVFWLGTGNWSKDYFHSSRNLGVVVKDRKLTSRLRQVFFTDWMGPYTYFVEPGKEYVPPQVGD